MSCPPLFIVFNAASGSDDSQDVRRQVAQRLQASGQAHEMFVVERGADFGATIGRAVHAAREVGGAVVAAGGDGTLNAVAQAVWNAQLVMGVLPLGTFNYFGRAQGIPTELDKAVEALLVSRVESVPLGMVADRVFLVNASVGLYPRLLEEREASKKVFGRYRVVAMLSALVTMLRGRSVLTLELLVHGQTRVIRTRTMFVGNNELQLRQLGLAEALDVEQGRLAAVTLQPLSVVRTLWLVLRGAVGRLDGAEGVDSFAFESLTVRPRRGARSMKVAMDGEVIRLETPLEFRVAPRPLRLLVPRTRTEDGGK